MVGHRGPSDSICVSSSWMLSRSALLCGRSFKARRNDFSASRGRFRPSWHFANPSIGPDVKRVAGENLLAIQGALGESPLEKIDEGPLVVSLGEVGCVGNQPGDQCLGLFELLAADRVPHRSRI